MSILLAQLGLVLSVLCGTFLVLVLPFLKVAPLEELGRMFKFGLWSSGLGLLFQAERHWLYISGTELLSFDSPLWIIKDFGIQIQALSVFCFIFSIAAWIKSHRFTSKTNSPG